MMLRIQLRIFEKEITKQNFFWSFMSTLIFTFSSTVTINPRTHWNRWIYFRGFISQRNPNFSKTLLGIVFRKPRSPWYCWICFCGLNENAEAYNVKRLPLSRQIQSNMWNYFSLRALEGGGVDWWTKQRVKNLMTLPL
jgi:hypothetical protein